MALPVDPLTYELEKDPENIGYSVDIQNNNLVSLHELLNNKTINTVGSVTRKGFIKWAAKTGIRVKIQDISVDLNNPLRSSALALLDIIQGGGTDGIDFSDQDNIDMLTGWVNAAELTLNQSNELLSLATTKISRIEELYGVGVTVSTNEVMRAIYKDDGTGRKW